MYNVEDCVPKFLVAFREEEEISKIEYQQKRKTLCMTAEDERISKYFTQRHICGLASLEMGNEMPFEIIAILQVSIEKQLKVSEIGTSSIQR